MVHQEPIQLKVFKLGRAVAICLPKALGFEAGETLLALPAGRALVLRPVNLNGWPEGYFESWQSLGDGPTREK